jgi:hypothetical protein
VGPGLQVPGTRGAQRLGRRAAPRGNAQPRRRTGPWRGLNPALRPGGRTPVADPAPHCLNPRACSHAAPARQSHSNGNQLWLNKLDRLAYKLCLRPERCANLTASGWPAIRPHPNQFEGTGQMCTPTRLPEGLCTDRRLYVHAVCRAGQHLKREAFEKLGLWFVHVDPEDPGRVSVELPAPGRLPCGGGAWARDPFAGGAPAPAPAALAPAAVAEAAAARRAKAAEDDARAAPAA